MLVLILLTWAVTAWLGSSDPLLVTHSLCSEPPIGHRRVYQPAEASTNAVTLPPGHAPKVMPSLVVNVSLTGFTTNTSSYDLTSDDTDDSEADRSQRNARDSASTTSDPSVGRSSHGSIFDGVGDINLPVVILQSTERSTGSNGDDSTNITIAMSDIVASSNTTAMTPLNLKDVTVIATDYAAAFTLFKQLYKRHYKSRREEAYRYRCFLINMATAYQKQTENPYALFGANNYSDYTDREFVILRNMSKSFETYRNEKKKERNRRRNSVDTDKAVDADEEAAVTSPPNANAADDEEDADLSLLARLEAKGNAFWRSSAQKPGGITNTSVTVRALDEHRRSFEKQSVVSAPTKLDWRLYGAVTPVRNQGLCGGCWAFATAGNIEGVWRIAGKPLTQLSEQSLISCDTYSGNMGCAGGVPQYAYNFVIKYQNGLMSRLDYYPFSSGSGVAPLCTAAQQVAGAAINRYVSIARDENVIMQYVANIGPVTAAIDSISWQSYSGGIMTNCLGLSVDHAVLIVGYDNNFTVPYWIIKNSWGTDWGEKGYIRVAKGSNQCLITTNPSTALAAAAVTILDPTTTSPPTTTMNTTTPANTTTPTTPAGTTVVPVPEVTTQKDSTAKPATTQTATTTGPKLTIRPVTDTPIIDIPGGILDDVDKELSFAVRIPISTAFVGVLFVAAAFMA